MIVPFNSLSSALWAVDAAYKAWDEARMAHAAADTLRRLSAEHDRLWNGYMTALFPNLAPKVETVIPTPSRKEGVIGRFGTNWGYVDWQGESLRFTRVLGYTGPLKQGMRVAFTMGEALCAVEVTLIGHAESEAAYAKVKASKDKQMAAEKTERERRERIKALRNGGRKS